MEDPLSTAREMIEQHETDITELWLEYFAVGGNGREIEFEAFLYGIPETFRRGCGPSPVCPERHRGAVRQVVADLVNKPGTV